MDKKVELLHSFHSENLQIGEVLDTNLKSGIPLAVLIPAPATTTTFLQRPSFTSRATDARPPWDDDLTAGEDGAVWSDLGAEGWGAGTESLLALGTFPLLEKKTVCALLCSFHYFFL